MIMEGKANMLMITEDLFFELIDRIIKHFEEKEMFKNEQEWLNGEEVMDILKISSKSTMQKLRDEGLVEFTQPMKRVILYRRSSVMDYLERHVRPVF